MGSRIEAGLTIEGSVRGEGELTVGGRLRGVLTLQGTLVVEEGGSVEAEVEASSVIVAGLLTGSVTAHEELRVLPGGCVDARVRATRLAMAEGAIFRGELQAASQPAPALAASTAQRLGSRPSPQQLNAGAHAADAIPPIPTLQKAPHAHMQVAAPPPPVHAQRSATINPPPPAARSFDDDELVPTPTTPAPPMPRPRRATIPPAPRVPDVSVEPQTARPPQSGSKPRAFSAPPPKARANDVPAPIAPREEAPKTRDRSASPRMPALPQKRGSMARRGGA